MSEPLRILFVCSGNICRSPMAEYLLKDKIEREAPGKMIALSAGTDTAGGAAPLSVTITVMNELGIDVTSHTSQPVTRKLLERCDVVLGMTFDHYERLAYLAPDNIELSTLGEYPDRPVNSKRDIEDPFGQSMERYRFYRDRISQEINRIFPVLLTRIQHK
jgi:protein-tyrosine-phosphatase